MPQDVFYQTDDWIKIRYQALKRAGGICQCCGDTPTKDNPLQVDHIKSRWQYPHLALDITNLQVLRKRCNMGKGAGDKADWRGAAKTIYSKYATQMDCIQESNGLLRIH
jgi:5-methylcytosine-specific restriction endonuclease McrA